MSRRIPTKSAEVALGADAVAIPAVPLADLMSGQFPDWFPDPTNSAIERFWDGSSWTSQTRLAIALPDSPVDGSPTEPLRLADFLQPIEPILAAILTRPQPAPQREPHE